MVKIFFNWKNCGKSDQFWQSFFLNNCLVKSLPNLVLSLSAQLKLLKNFRVHIAHTLSNMWLFGYFLYYCDVKICQKIVMHKSHAVAMLQWIDITELVSGKIIVILGLRSCLKGRITKSETGISKLKKLKKKSLLHLFSVADPLQKVSSALQKHFGT